MTQKLKKFVAIATLMASVMMVAAPSPAYALTADELAEQIATLTEQLAALTAQLGELEGDEEEEEAAAVTIEGCEISSFDRNLKEGMSGDDVKCLQIVMNSDPDTKLGDEGAGSPGNETSYFGPITKAGVIKFQEKYADEVLASWGLTAGTGFVGSTSRTKLDELLTGGAGEVAEEEEEEEGVCSEITDAVECVTADCSWNATTDVCSGVVAEEDEDVEEGDEEEEAAVEYSVTLADGNPVAAVLMSSSAYNEVLRVKISAGPDADVDITSITVERFGITVDARVAGVLIQDEDGNRHGNVYTLSEKVAAIVFSSNPISIAAGESVDISVLVHLDATANTGTIGMKITAMSDDPSGLPVSSNVFSLASSSGILGAITAKVVNVASSSRSIDIGVTQQLLTRFQLAETSSAEDVYLKKLTLYNNGNTVDEDVANWDLVSHAGAILATVEQSDGKYIEFDLSNDPYEIPKGTSRNFSVYLDAVSGSSRTIQGVIMNDYDLVLEGEDTGAKLLASALDVAGASSSFPIGNLGAVAGYNLLTLAPGELIANASYDTPAGFVAAGGTNVTLAKFDLKATGEDMEVRSMEIYFSTLVATDKGSDGANNPNDMFSGVITLQTSDGVSRWSETVSASQPVEVAGTAETMSSYFTITAGTTETISIVGNLRTDITASDSFTWSIKDIVVKRLTTGDYTTKVSTAVAASTLTGSTGDLTVVRTTAWGNQTLVIGGGMSEAKIGSYIFQTGSAEGVNISMIVVDIADNTGVTNMMLKVGATQIGSTITSPATANNSFSAGGELDITASSQAQVDVYADLTSSAVNPTTTMNDGDVEGIGASSQQDVASSGTISGQTISVISTGFLTVATGTNPISAVLHAGDTEVPLLGIKFTAVYESVKIEELVLQALNGDGNWTNLTLKKGATVIKSGVSFVNNVATFSGLTEVVPYGSATYQVVADTTYANTLVSADLSSLSFGSVLARGVSSNTEIVESVTTTELASASSTVDYNVGEIVFDSEAMDNYGIVTTALADGSDLVGDGIVTSVVEVAAVADLLAVTESLTKFPGTTACAISSTVCTFTTSIGDIVYLYDATAAADSSFAIVTTADATIDADSTLNGVGLDGDGGVLAVTMDAGDLLVKLANTSYESNMGASTQAYVVGDVVAYYDADTATTGGFYVVTTARSAAYDLTGAGDTLDLRGEADVSAVTYAAAATDYLVKLTTVSTEAPTIGTTAATYDYNVGDIVYIYDATAENTASGFYVVKTALRKGDTWASGSLGTAVTLATNDMITKALADDVVDSNIMTMHDGEPIISLNSGSPATGSQILGANQVMAIYDIKAEGGDVLVKSLTIKTDGSGNAHAATTVIQIYVGGSLAGTGTQVSNEIKITLDTPVDISKDETVAFTVKVDTGSGWSVGETLLAMIDGTKGQTGAGIEWYYASLQSGTAPSLASPVSITDSELPINGNIFSY